MIAKRSSVILQRVVVEPKPQNQTIMIANLALSRQRCVLQSAEIALPRWARIIIFWHSRPAWQCVFCTLQHLCSESASFAAKIVGICGLGSAATRCKIRGDLCLIMCSRPFILRVSLHISRLQASTSYNMSHKVSHFSQACTTTLTQMMLPNKLCFTRKAEQPCLRL